MLPRLSSGRRLAIQARLYLSGPNQNSICAPTPGRLEHSSHGEEKQPSVAPSENDRLERIKRQVVIAIFSDDYLMERLVLKGGNAIDLILNVGTRASVDIDLSMENDFPADEREKIRQRLQNRLQDVSCRTT
ncbi:MAG: nucleotidyl transferase AbiEii/AbiGii toxin family protein [Limisphaerales bacterium]